MTIRRLTGAAILALSLTATVDAGAHEMQPGMLTMIQRGGTEGVLLGSILPGVGAYDPYDGRAYDQTPYGHRRHRPRRVPDVKN